MSSPSVLTRLSGSLTERGLIRPPRLETDSERSATRLELFFDLAFVLVVAELATRLDADFTPRGAIIYAGLFTAVWWCWLSSTLYANRFDTDDIVFRLLKLGGMLGVIGMAASATGATAEFSTQFAACFVAHRGLLFLQYLRAYRHVPEARSGTRLYLIGAGVGATLWALSIPVDGPLRYWLWGAGLVVEMGVPLAATVSAGDVPLHLEHLPDRFALFTILVLGESIAAVAHGVHDAKWTSASVAVAALAFVLAAGLWWNYFDLAGAAAKQMLLERGGGRSTFAHDIYVYGHLPIALSLAAVGAGIEHAILESTREDASGATRTALCAGVALYLLVISAINVSLTRRSRRVWAWPAVAAGIAVADAVFALPVVVVIGVLAALIVVVVVGGLMQQQTSPEEFEAV